MGKPAAVTVTSDFKVGDLVWAKMESFAPWPAKIVNPPANVQKAKKGLENGYCVFFFGSNNYSWIKPHNLKPYLQFKAALSNASKTSSFKTAIVQIDKFIEKKEELGHDFDPIEMVTNDADVEFNKSQPSSSTPKEKNKKEKSTPAKRRHTESSVNQSSKKSRFQASTTLDDSSSSIGASPNKSIRRRYHNLLNRPSAFSRPSTPPLDLHAIPPEFADKNIEPSKLTFGFLGAGAIGSCLIRNLKVSGHNMVVWNRSAEKLTSFEELGVTIVQTPQDVIQQADITFSCVSDTVAAKNIVFGNCGVLKADLTNKGYVEMTGIDSETSLDIADAINGAGGRYLEAQLLGNRNQAEYGTMIIIAAGDSGVFKDCFSCFKVIARHSYHLKEIGHACKMSLVFNLITGITIAGLAEGLALADRVGIEQTDIQKILQNTRIACPEILEKCEHIINDPYVKNFPLKHMQKYLRLALNMADPMEQSLPLTATTNEIYKHTKRLGYSDYDVASTIWSHNYSNYTSTKNKNVEKMVCIDSQGESETTMTSNPAEDSSINASTGKVEENGVDESKTDAETLNEVVIKNGTTTLDDIVDNSIKEVVDILKDGKKDPVLVE